MTARVYVGTYAKYNNGNLFGKWLELEDYSDKEGFLEECEELHSDEEDPELMFQDWEGIPNGMISESHIDDEVWEMLEAYNEHDEGAVNAYCSLFGSWNKRDFEDRYRGQYSSWRDFAEELVDEMGYLAEMPDHLQNYFDYDAYARDLRFDFCEGDGYYFWKN